jgi:hypothetical protein
MTTGEVIAHLDDLRFPLPQLDTDLVKFVQRVVTERQRMVIPPDFDPLAPTMNPETIAFLGQWQIGDMWRNDPFVGLAVDLLDDAVVRRMIEALLLGPISPMAIAQRIRNRFGFEESVMNVRVIRAFSHYFWDASALNPAEWKTLIARWLPDQNNYDYLGALQSPRSPAGAALTLALVDRSADGLSPVVQYSAFRDHGFNLFMEHALLQSKPSLQRTQGAFMAFNMVKMADEELTKHRGGSADLLDAFRQIETRYDHTAIATVKDLPALSPAIIDVEPVVEEVPLHEEDKEIA